METIITTILLLLGPVALLVAYQLAPDWFNVRRNITIGIVTALVAVIIAGSWAWTSHKAADIRKSGPVITINPAERARMDAGPGLR